MSKVENFMDSKEGESQSSEQLGQQTTELKTYVRKRKKVQFVKSTIHHTAVRHLNLGGGGGLGEPTCCSEQLVVLPPSTGNSSS